MRQASWEKLSPTEFTKVPAVSEEATLDPSFFAHAVHRMRVSGDLYNKCKETSKPRETECNWDYWCPCNLGGGSHRPSSFTHAVHRMRVMWGSLWIWLNTGRQACRSGIPNQALWRSWLWIASVCTISTQWQRWAGCFYSCVWILNPFPLLALFPCLSGIEEDAHTTIVNGEDHIVECLGFFKFDGRELCNCTD